MLAGCVGPPAIAREGWTLIDILTTSERRDFQTETVDVRNCGVPAAAERKNTECAAGSSANFSVGVQAQAGAGAGVVVANLDVSVGASTAFELGFDRSSGESLDLETPPQGFVNRYWIEKEFRILSGNGRIQHKDGDIEGGVYTLQTGCFLRIERVQTLACEAANTPTPSPASVPPTRAPTPVPVEPTATPTPESTNAGEDPAAGAVREIDGIAFVYVPAGEFTMGSNDGGSNEQPVHTVYLDGYWMMRTEVMNEQFGKFIDADGYTIERYWTVEGWKWRTGANLSLPRYWDDSQYNGAEQPVVGVSWYEAVAYANWLAEYTGLALRLPTEAEWEKAARGTDGRVYPWGNAEPTERLLNFNNTVGRPVAVGSYPEGVSPYGALDMAGNVWEWVGDWYAGDYYVNSPKENPQGPGAGEYRVLRGGSFSFNLYNTRCAYRNWFGPGYGLTDFGFRLLSPGS